MNNLKEGKFGLRSRARELRSQGYSYRDIQKMLNVSRSTIYYWVKNLHLTDTEKLVQSQRRWEAQKKGAAARKRQYLLRNNQIEAESVIQARLFINDPLWVVGVTLYWAEGSKQKPWHPSACVQFINTDPQTHKIFCAFMKKYFNLTDDAFGYSFYIHADADLVGGVMYWSEQLGISQDKIKVYFKKSKGLTKRHNYGKIYKGILSIRVKCSAAYNRRIASWARAMIPLLPHSGIA